MRITYRYKYRYYPQAPELNERSKRVCFLTHPIWGFALGSGLGAFSGVLFPNSVNIPLTLICVGMISGPVLMHLLRKKILARYDEEYMQLIKSLQKRKLNRYVNSVEEISRVKQLQPESDRLMRQETKISRPVNSAEVISKVKQLQPELDRLIRQEYEERVRFDIEKIKAGASNYVDYFRSVMERSRYKLSEDEVETAALSSFDDLKKSYADYLMACPMSPAKEQAYIAKRADNDMHRFGACHAIWNTQKRILKEKYGIEWYTPNETHPDIIFD